MAGYQDVGVNRTFMSLGRPAQAFVEKNVVFIGKKDLAFVASVLDDVPGLTGKA